MIWKTSEDIIRLFERLTGRKWRVVDDRLASRYNQADRRLIEIGMLTTAINFKGQQINSFKYFVGQIESTFEDVQSTRLGDSAIDELLASRRRWWQRKQAGFKLSDLNR